MASIDELDELIAEEEEAISALEAQLREHQARRVQLLQAKQAALENQSPLPAAAAAIGQGNGDNAEGDEGDECVREAEVAGAEKKPQFVGHDIAMNLAKDCLKSGDFAHAQQILEGVVKLDPNCFEALLQLAFVSDVSHNEQGFEQWIDKALAVNQHHAQAWIYKAMCVERRGNYVAALAAFRKAKDIDPDGAFGKDALQQESILQRNMGCPLVPRPVWEEAAPQILEQRRREQPVELEGHWLVHPRSSLRGEHCIRIWDDIFGPELLSRLRDSVRDLSMFLHRNPKHCRTFWLARDAQPKAAAELAGRILLEKCLGLRTEDLVGIEWWCKSQSASLGAHFHYDAAVADGGYFRPTYSSVLYLSDEGGPTVILDQAADKHRPQWPEIPQEGYVVMPRVNRWMAFPGELRHGMVPIDDDARPRYVILFNFWCNHQPSAPNCQAPDLSSYAPLCAKAPTARHLLPKEQLDAMRAQEETRELDDPASGPISVPVVTLCSMADFEWSSSFGELPLAMPMPSLRRMRCGPRDAAVFYMPWRQLAKEHASIHKPALLTAVARRPIPRLTERLLLWELHGDDQRMRRRAAAIRSWLDGAFVEKAKSLAEAELIKAIDSGNDETKLGLVSLTKYIRNELKLPLPPSQLDGAFLSQNMACVEAKPCDADTLHAALFDVLEAKIRAWCRERHRKPHCLRIQEPHHGLVMNCSGLVSSLSS